MLLTALLAAQVFTPPHLSQVRAAPSRTSLLTLQPFPVLARGMGVESKSLRAAHPGANQCGGWIVSLCSVCNWEKEREH
eukprot:2379220-Rhodomonas_salina.1